MAIEVATDEAEVVAARVLGLERAATEVTAVATREEDTTVAAMERVATKEVAPTAVQVGGEKARGNTRCTLSIYVTAKRIWLTTPECGLHTRHHIDWVVATAVLVVAKPGAETTEREAPVEAKETRTTRGSLAALQRLSRRTACLRNRQNRFESFPHRRGQFGGCRPIETSGHQ